MDNSLMGEIALRCNDINFKDFGKSTYERCFLRASRKVARRYELIQRIYEFDSEIPDYSNLSSDKQTEKLNEEIIFNLSSFKAEYMVKVNNYEYTKVKRIEVGGYQYVLYRDENKILFNYSPRSENDKIELRYTADINIDDYDIEDLEPVIPSQFNEELISFACVEIAKLGIIKYANSGEGKKYENILKLYGTDERELNKDLIKNESWIEMQIWKPY